MREKYLFMDFKRLVKRQASYLAILGVTAALFYSLEKSGLRNEVLNTYSMAIRLSGSTLTFVFCTIPFAFSFCEDLESHYIRYQVVRGNLLKYVLSKVTVIYLSAVMTMVLGSIVFLLLCRTRLPWMERRDSCMDFLLTGMYANLLEQGHYFLYCVLYSLGFGTLAAMLAVGAAFFSLYVSNKVMILVIPVCIYQICTRVFRGYYLSVFIFHAYVKIFKYDWQCFLHMLMLSMVPTAMFTVGIYLKLKKRM